ncbi:hypothetical protein [Tenacibaculum maritimum]|uniref:hypothetical protein n=1 Tax=Tenacibaculum maritimum TaxID=107401 RepID=UPI0012E67ECB|nr:hypothetical protein [Tenacibaculum maritimum]CAA0156959.1 conserved hypothetical protein [Tenacibaculum maritimum]CAA0170140.1 conserved hypothetical protein [Tenacibaculum maritimum]CAA0172750.1 conserved hypothetical protein [Tenacibaculum maritimum]CAA0239213.1 conserved hypothetical protein [Tenacibaculum maritimum]
MDVVKFSKDSMFQQIKASFLDDSFELTPIAEEKKKRMRHAFAMRLKNKMTRHQAIEKLQKEYGISQSTAYRDYNWAMQIFGDLDATDKNAERMIIADAYWQLYQMSLADRNIEQARKALDSYKSLFNFDDNEIQIDPNKIQAHEYHIHLSREGNKILRETLSKGVVDFNSVAEYVDFEDVTDEDE